MMGELAVALHCGALRERLPPFAIATIPQAAHVISLSYCRSVVLRRNHKASMRRFSHGTIVRQPIFAGA
jgi:hypothetical protein